METHAYTACAPEDPAELVQGHTFVTCKGVFGRCQASLRVCLCSNLLAYGRKTHQAFCCAVLLTSEACLSVGSAIAGGSLGHQCRYAAAGHPGLVLRAQNRLDTLLLHQKLPKFP